MHANEQQLRDLYAVFAAGDLDGFLAGCTDDVTFVVPGDTPLSGKYTRAEFVPWIVTVMERSEGTFREDVLDVFANDEHGVLLLHHELERAGARRQYETAHVVTFRDGRIATWEERPGSLAEFEAAWGRD